MALSRPLANKPQLVSACELSDLADADLAEVFKWLPPYDRLLVSLVCKRWRDISRNAWLDTVYLDLSPIPGPNLAAIIGQCPNLRTVFAKEKAFGLNELKILSLIPQLSLTLYECSSRITAPPGSSCVEDALAATFSNNLASASWTELSLADFRMMARERDGVQLKIGLPASLPTSLKRLQLSELSIKRDKRPYAPFSDKVFDGLERLQQLECLYLYNASRTEAATPITLGGMESLSSLRELYLGAFHYVVPLLPRLAHLPKLEVLFLLTISFEHPSSSPTNSACLRRLASEHPTLRILVLKGSAPIEIELSPRRRFPNGLGSSPAPLLHIFLNKELLEKFRFPTPFDSAVVHTFNEPLAQFLDKDEIKPIFEGVWIAEKIKETVDLGDCVCL